MNSGLVGSICLVVYGIYTFYEAKTSGADLNLLLYGKVGIATVCGSLGVLYNFKDVIQTFIKEKVKKTPALPKPETQENSMNVKSLDLTELEVQDNYCLSYLAKRIKGASLDNPANNQLVKDLVAAFYDIHVAESPSKE